MAAAHEPRASLRPVRLSGAGLRQYRRRHAGDVVRWLRRASRLAGAAARDPGRGRRQLPRRGRLVPRRPPVGRAASRLAPPLGRAGGSGPAAARALGCAGAPWRALRAGPVHRRPARGRPLRRARRPLHGAQRRGCAGLGRSLRYPGLPARPRGRAGVGRDRALRAAGGARPARPGPPLDRGGVAAPLAPHGDGRAWLSGARPRLRQVWRGLSAILLLWLVLAYFFLPWAWWFAERGRHPQLETLPVRTTNADGIPGDPINVGLVGTREELIGAMLAAGWYPADPITLRSSIGIAASVLLRRPDPDAPVSPLYLFGRKQDLAFEQEVGRSANRRHHVRWWLTDRIEDGLPFWLGGASFDRDSGFSHLTGQITHHIDPDPDA